MSILDKVVAAVTPSSSAVETNAIDLLKTDHDEVDALFKDYDLLAEGDGDAGDKRELSTRICGMLAVHAMTTCRKWTAASVAQLLAHYEVIRRCLRWRIELP